jgi:hypothetical protein
MADTQASLAAEIRATNNIIRANTDQVLKGQGEVVNKILDLEKLLADGAPTAELIAAVAELKGTATAQTTATQTLDDVVPDAVPTPA